MKKIIINTIKTKEKMPRLFHQELNCHIFAINVMSFVSQIRSCCFSLVVRDGFFGKFEVEFDGQINTFPVRIGVLWTLYPFAEHSS